MFDKVIKTKRLILRPWSEADFEPFAKLNADPKVREYFPSLLSKEESDKQAQLIKEKIEKNGWGLWAVSVPNEAEFIGFIGLAPVDFHAHFTPAVEIGWRLACDYWGYGYATEGAKAALEFGFEKLLLEEIVSLTAVENMRSRKVMEKIGMRHDPKDDFDHPKVPEGHKLKRQVLYRLSREDWSQIA